MRAAVCRTYGPPDVVTVEQVDDPIPGPGEALVRVRAAAVNFPDVLLVANQYQVPVPVPFVPGSELAGEVVALGDGVTTAGDGLPLAVGDEVFGTQFVGAFAELTTIGAVALTHIPPGVDPAAAAGFNVAHGTAYHALRSVAEVRPGEWVVVLGAAGGVGLAAVEIAVALGARVLAAARGADKLALCTERGAAATVDYDAEDLKARIRELTGGGADVVLDPVGGPYAEAALRACRYGARFVTVGFASGDIPRIPLNLVLLKGVAIKGFEMRSFLTNEPALVARDRAELLARLADGSLRPHLGATFGLSEVPEALAHVATRKALGKVVVDPTR